jgi:hypothetical protein
MGANAQTSVPTFTAGEILTAANMNISARTGIPVFADATARDAAFGGTGEKTLAEGQFAYLESTNATQYYDGAAWQAVGVAPGLVLISSTTIGTTVATVTVSNAFSSTYDNYSIIISGGVSSSSASNNNITFQLGATTTGYYWALPMSNFAGTYIGAGGSNVSKWERVGMADSTNINMAMDIYYPNLAKNTLFKALRVGIQDSGYSGMAVGYQSSTTQFTAFTIGLETAGTFTGGTIRVYGYANS